jgi:hypothetical protein
MCPLPSLSTAGRLELVRGRQQVVPRRGRLDAVGLEESGVVEQHVQRDFGRHGVDAAVARVLHELADGRAEPVEPGLTGLRVFLFEVGLEIEQRAVVGPVEQGRVGAVEHPVVHVEGVTRAPALLDGGPRLRVGEDELDVGAAVTGLHPRSLRPGVPSADRTPTSSSVPLMLSRHFAGSGLSVLVLPALVHAAKKKAAIVAQASLRIDLISVLPFLRMYEDWSRIKED